MRVSTRSWHLPCCSFREASNIYVHTSSSETVHFLPLFALYHLTIAFNAAQDWSILRCVMLRIFRLLMAPTMLLVSRFYDFSSAHIDILDCTASLTLCALASHHCLQCNSSLEHSTVHGIAHFSFPYGTFHAARFEVLRFLECTHQDLGLYSI